MRTERCADCGAEIHAVSRDRVRRWASGDSGQQTFVCRYKIENGVIINADYHYVEGETQRHFPVRSE